MVLVKNRLIYTIIVIVKSKTCTYRSNKAYVKSEP